MTTTLMAESGWSQSEVAQSRPTLCDPMDCSLPGCSLHGILQARVLELGAISFSRGSSQPRDRTWVSHIPGRRCNLWATREALGLHRTIQLQLLQRYWSGHRLGLLWYWMVCLGNEQRSLWIRNTEKWLSILPVMYDHHQLAKCETSL